MGAVAPLAVGLYSAKKSSDAQKRAAEQQAQLAQQQRETAEPFLEKARWALPKMQAAIQQYLIPQMGKESPYLKPLHEKSLVDIERQKKQGLARTMQYWGATGNVGRARGEQLRIARGATEAVGAENLAYGQAREASRQEGTERAFNAMGYMANLGGAGLQPSLSATQSAMSAIQARVGAQTGFWGDIGAIAGTVYGDIEARKERERERIWMERVYGTAKTTGVDPLSYGAQKGWLSKVP